jgi:hypothetical protein
VPVQRRPSPWSTSFSTPHGLQLDLVNQRIVKASEGLEGAPGLLPK